MRKFLTADRARVAHTCSDWSVHTGLGAACEGGFDDAAGGGAGFAVDCDTGLKMRAKEVNMCQHVRE